MSYLERLDRDLAAAGIRGRRHARILSEFADHLRCDPDAQLGDPGELARQFADELGTVLARRAAFVAFMGLAVAGLLFGIGFISARRQLFVSASAATPPLGTLGAWMTVLGAQVAFVAGGLAALRALRRRSQGVISRDEAGVLTRRAAVGVGAGLVTMAGFGLSALALRGHVVGWWTTLALSLASAGILTLLAATPAVLAAARLRPLAAGSAGDLYVDFGPFVPRALHGRPWRFALAVAGTIVVVIAAVGIVQSDPFDGALRAVADGLACLVGFGVLGRFLGLRS
ncbi:MAG: hypothetical protein ACM3UX_01595 [Candidatus Woesearchaeota archaeon]